jgi:putative NADPH-quinone reductase
MKTLYIVAHPDLSTSMATNIIRSEIEKSKDPDYLLIWDDGPKYNTPTVEYYQALLLEADIIVLQFPLYWSHFPSCLKSFIDNVFTEGFAFGKDNDSHKLKDKTIILSTTAGATKTSYQYGGFNHHCYEYYFNAMVAPFRSAKMRIEKPFITYEVTKESAMTHAEDLIKYVECLTKSN